MEKDSEFRQKISETNSNKSVVEKDIYMVNFDKWSQKEKIYIFRQSIAEKILQDFAKDCRKTLEFCETIGRRKKILKISNWSQEKWQNLF